MRRRIHACRALLPVLASLIVLVPALAAAEDTDAKATFTREEHIEQALDRPCEVAFENRPLTEVVAGLEKHYRIAVWLDSLTFQEAGIDHKSPVTLRKGGRLAAELNQSLRPFGLTYIVLDEALVITTNAAAESKLEIRVYPVRDLVKLTNLDSNRLREPYDNIMELIWQTIAPTSWSSVGGFGFADVYANCGALVVLQSAEVHREIEAVLTAVRAAQENPGVDSADPPPKVNSPVKCSLRGGAVRVAGNSIIAGKFNAKMRTKIEQALAADASLDLDGKPLKGAVVQLAQRFEIPIRLDAKSLLESGIDSQVPIRWAIAHRSLRSALRFMLRDLDLIWVIRDDVLQITTKASAEQLQEIRVYSVADLVMPPEPTGACETRPDYDTLFEIITATVHPTSWPAIGGSMSFPVLQPLGVFVLAQTQEVHEEIVQILAMLREARRRQFKEQVLESIPAIDDQQLVLRAYRVGVIPTPAGSGLGANGGGFFNFDDAEPDRSFRPLNQVGGGTTTPPATAKGETATASTVDRDRVMAEQLAKAIPELVEPKSWQAAGGKGKIFAVGNRLLVSQSCEVHAKIRDLLTAVAR